MTDRAFATRLEILTLLAEEPARACTVRELSDRLGLPPSRVYHACRKLVREGRMEARRGAKTGQRVYVITEAGLDHAVTETMISHPALRSWRSWLGLLGRRRP